jgi:hypothetical protein
MRDWLETAHHAGKLASSNDYPEMKGMMEKIGTNRKVKDKAVGVDLQPPYNILLKYKALQGSQEGSKESKEKGRTSEKPDRLLLSGWQDSNSWPVCTWYLKLIISYLFGFIKTLY